MALVLTYDCRWRHDRFSHDVIARGGIPSYRDVLLVPYSAETLKRGDKNVSADTYQWAEVVKKLWETIAIPNIL